MSDHRRSVHKQRVFQCEFCGKSFKNGSTLKSHVFALHVDHSQRPLRCAFCGRGFLVRRVSVRSLRLTTSLPSLQHESRLRAHEVIHRDEMPFRCAFCGRGNKTKSNNLKHEKRCGMQQLQSALNEEAGWRQESMFHAGIL